MNHCDYCSKPLTGKKVKHCNRACSSAAWRRDNPGKHEASVSKYRSKKPVMRDGMAIRPASPDKAERYARIKAQYGAPGMGISPNTRKRVMKAWKL